MKNSSIKRQRLAKWIISHDPTLCCLKDIIKRRKWKENLQCGWNSNKSCTLKCSISKICKELLQLNDKKAKTKNPGIKNNLNFL